MRMWRDLTITECTLTMICIETKGERENRFKDFRFLKRSKQ